MTLYSDVTDLREKELLAWAWKHLPEPNSNLVPLNGDASFRRYFRLGNVIAVDSPPDSQKNEEFIRINSKLSQMGIRVPKVISADLNQGFMLLEDLGSTHLLDAESVSNRTFWYEKAVSTALALGTVSDPMLPGFDRDFMMMELEIFTEWMLDKKLGLVLSESEQHMLEQSFDFLITRIEGMPQTAMHRDFHSRNLMIAADELAVIDYQDMVTGPYAYDLASLLYDCYVVLPESLKEHLITQAFKSPQIQILGIADRESFDSDIKLCAVQRHLKVLGIFERLYIRDGRDGYLKDLPRVLNYLLQNCPCYEELRELASFIKTRILERL